jgi:catecholate siderophore receptor
MALSSSSFPSSVRLYSRAQALSRLIARGCPLSLALLCAMTADPTHPAFAATRLPLDQQVERLASRVGGTVVDPSGAIVAGAVVTLGSGSTARTTTTDAAGRFVFDDVPAGPLVLTVTFAHFASSVVGLPGPDESVRVLLRPGAISEAVIVRATPPAFPRTTTATRTDVPLVNVPQAVTIIPRDLIADVMMQGMGDVMRFVPGVGMAQGEGHRDAPILRGNTSTSDFFVDGVRDDTQYFRDLYNAERVEILKGPNGMIFGRGGVGGVINRVTRQANGSTSREISASGGSWGHRRLTADVAQAVSSRVSTRVTGLIENSDSYRKEVGLESYGVNPTVAIALGPRTTLRTGYEFFQHERTVDRGIPSFAGAPLETDWSTFFGNADVNRSKVAVHSVGGSIDHELTDRVTLKTRVSYADYDKFYQNLVPESVNAAGMAVTLSGYNAGTQRQNLFSQTDVIVLQRTGQVSHTILAGMELGRQITDNRRLTAFFPALGSSVTSTLVPLSDPTTDLFVEFRPVASDANNRGVATTAGFYLQDQLALSSRLLAIVGLRYDRFRVDLLDRRTDERFRGEDDLVSPRLGLVFKPLATLSVYGNYSRSYLPRAGEQLSSLSASNRALDPEEFQNVEAGVKWEVTPALALATAVYRLNRGNVVVADPLDPTTSLLVDAERTTGLEVEASGTVANRWRLHAGYAYQHGEVTRSLSPTVLAGARLGQVPRHTFSLWNRYEISRRWGVGLGVSSRGESFIATDNAVVLPSFTRVDAAVFVTLTGGLRLNVNVENLFDERYYAAAHSNNNITPGSPRAVRVLVHARF